MRLSDGCSEVFTGAAGHTEFRPLAWKLDQGLGSHISSLSLLSLTDDSGFEDFGSSMSTVYFPNIERLQIVSRFACITLMPLYFLNTATLC